VYLPVNVLKFPDLAERLKKESSDDEPIAAPKLEVARYGTTPRKCLPPATLPVIVRLPLLSIGLGLRTRPLRTLLDGTRPEPTGLLIAGFLIAQPVPKKKVRNTTAAINNNRAFIILNTPYPHGYVHN